jgi:hypothetical protein
MNEGHLQDLMLEQQLVVPFQFTLLPLALQSALLCNKNPVQW